MGPTMMTSPASAAVPLASLLLRRCSTSQEPGGGSSWSFVPWRAVEESEEVPGGGGGGGRGAGGRRAAPQGRGGGGAVRLEGGVVPAVPGQGGARRRGAAAHRVRPPARALPRRRRRAALPRGPVPAQVSEAVGRPDRRRRDRVPLPWLAVRRRGQVRQDPTAAGGRQDPAERVRAQLRGARLAGRGAGVDVGREPGGRAEAAVVRAVRAGGVHRPVDGARAPLRPLHPAGESHGPGTRAHLPRPHRLDGQARGRAAALLRGHRAHRQGVRRLLGPHAHAAPPQPAPIRGPLRAHQHARVHRQEGQGAVLLRALPLPPRGAGQGRSMLIVRFGSTARSPLAKEFPSWYFHQNACKLFEQDMGFLSSQNEVLLREKVPTRELYLNLRSSDTWVAEYRKWMDTAGHGMPYYFGHSTLAPPPVPAVVEQAPAGAVAGMSASFPAKGGVGTTHAPNPSNRYFRHVVHCKGCRASVKKYTTLKDVFAALAAAAILAATRQWKAVLVAASYACDAVISLITTNFIRTHRRL